MAQTADSIIVGVSNEALLTQGWHERQRDGRNNIPFRAAKKKGTIHLTNPDKKETLNLILSGPVGIVQTPLKGTIVINNQEHPLELNVDTWVLRSYPIPDKTEQLTIHLILPTPVIPDNHLHNGDPRQLGWYLSAAWLE